MFTKKPGDEKNYRPNFKTRLLAYRKQKNLIPNHIFLIWIGKDIPNTPERPYFQNVINQKLLRPEAIVEILVNQKLLEESSRWSSLKALAVKNGISLRDIESTCKNYINYDIVLELMKKEEDYVRASDILRLSLIYHEGGEYYDIDLSVFRSVQPPMDRNPLLGFYQFYDEEGNIQPFFQAAVKGHFIYLYASVIVRYFYKSLEEELKSCNNPKSHWINSIFSNIRQLIVTEGSGNHIMYFLDLFDMSSLRSLISYNLNENYKIKMDLNWLKQYIHPIKELPDQVTAWKPHLSELEKDKMVSFLREQCLRSSKNCKDFFEKRWELIEKNDGDFLNQKEKEYFGLDHLFPLQEVEVQKEMDEARILDRGTAVVKTLLNLGMFSSGTHNNKKFFQTMLEYEGMKDVDAKVSIAVAIENLNGALTR